jgi:hypothetical protein
MQQMQHRQGKRLVRTAASLERLLFDFINDLQDAGRDNWNVWSWGEALSRLESMREKLNVMRDLVHNTTRELAAAQIAAKGG